LGIFIPRMGDDCYCRRLAHYRISADLPHMESSGQRRQKKISV
jgi:hypothetical protein